MAAAQRLFFRPVQRLRTSREFESVYRSRQNSKTALFALYYRINDCGFDRLGLTVSRKLGDAVRRNRIKRTIRELFRTNPESQGPWIDIVVRPEKRFSDTGYAELQRAWVTALRTIRDRLRAK